MVPSAFISAIAALTGATRSEPLGKMKPKSSVPSGVADQLEGVGVGADIALAAGAVGQHQVDVAGAQRLDAGAEGLEELDARVGLVAVEHLVDRDVERRGAGLGADQALLEGGEARASVKRSSSARTSMRISERM